MATEYYDWNKTLSYDAEVTMVVGTRSIGKTFGLRLQLIKDFLKHGWKFVEVARYSKNKEKIASKYFDKIVSLGFFDDYVFKTNKNFAYVAKKPINDEKPDWQQFGYFVALSQEQQEKMNTFENVKRVIFDESIIDKKERYYRYLNNEFSKIANIFSTVTRENPNQKNGIQPRLYLLGNSIDFLNPYFERYKIPANITFGYSWHDNKRMLLHYVDSSNISGAQLQDTVYGHLIAGTSDEINLSKNFFEKPDENFIEIKPKSASFIFGIVFNKKKFGIWSDDELYYINSKIVNNTIKPIYALTLDDFSINYKVAKKCNANLKILCELFENAYLRFENSNIQMNFLEMLRKFGYN